jgi:hypothetical protein
MFHLGVLRQRLDFLMVSPAGLIEFQQPFIFCRNLVLPLRQIHRVDFLGRDNGVVEASGVPARKKAGPGVVNWVLPSQILTLRTPPPCVIIPRCNS